MKVKFDLKNAKVISAKIFFKVVNNALVFICSRSRLTYQI